MKSFDIPEFYKSDIINTIKQFRKIKDPLKKDFTPTVLDFGSVQFLIARHFGFCYGVENAIEIAFKAINENPNKRIFLLSEMIHNPAVNADLMQRGVQFLQDTNGNALIPFNTLTSQDIVLIPAFGAPLQTIEALEKKGIVLKTYDTTCPFVVRVWKKAEQLAKLNCTIIIHGKKNHEETKSTFSRSDKYSKTIIIKDMEEAKQLAQFMLQNQNQHEFDWQFKNACSEKLDITTDLNNIGVINQTTMLATETQAISDYFKQIIVQKFGPEQIQNHFADTRDTLCYATNENQNATYSLLQSEADMAIVVGGYNSSNTQHLVELCETKFKTYFVSSSNNFDNNTICHFDIHSQQEKKTDGYLPSKLPIKIVLTCGASCPDYQLELVMRKLLSFFSNTKSINDLINTFK